VKYFIDCGANNGSSVRHFRKVYDRNEQYFIYSFESHPKLAKDFSHFKNHTLISKAVWIEDGHIDFYLGSNDHAGSLIAEKKTGKLDLQNPLRVPSIDFSSWIRETFSTSDELLLKLDIEGAEYQVLAKMLHDGTMDRVSKLFIEWHWDKIGMPKTEHERLVEAIRRKNIPIISWDAAGAERESIRSRSFRLIHTQASRLRSDAYSVITVVAKSPLRHVLKGLVTLRTPAERARRVVAARKLTIQPSESDHVRSLQRRGFTIVSGEIDQSMADELTKFGESKALHEEELRDRQMNRGKPFWVRLTDDDVACRKLTTSHILVRYALQENVLRMVAAYLGEVPRLNSVLITLSQHTDSDPQISQNWHCDRDDTKVVKLFTYLSDVPNDEYGPFTLVDRSVSDKVRYGFVMRHMTDTEFFSQVPRDAPMQITGPKLTSFLVDTTRCFHLGSRVASGRTRLMFTALYTAIPSMFPNPIKTPTIDCKLSTLQRIVVMS
jgi:FkbM family methyltransferase